MILYGHNRQGVVTQAFNGFVIHAAMRNGYVSFGKALFVYSEAVVLGRNVYAARAEVFNRMVRTAMTKAHFVRGTAQSEG